LAKLESQVVVNDLATAWRVSVKSVNC